MPTCTSWPGPRPNPFTYHSAQCDEDITVTTPYVAGWSCARWYAEHELNVAIAQDECPPG